MGPGIFVAVLGVLVLFFGLSSEVLTIMEKIPVLIVCVALIILGILIETPVLEYLKGVEIPEESFT